ncbi:hypothetical protein M1N19_02285, partial [Dehalococcoidia bacterium]|nr:hypothetical protein [Dehalococcoidia bacterium]
VLPGECGRLPTTARYARNGSLHKDGDYSFSSAMRLPIPLFKTLALWRSLRYFVERIFQVSQR